MNEKRCTKERVVLRLGIVASPIPVKTELTISTSAENLSVSDYRLSLGGCAGLYPY